MSKIFAIIGTTASGKSSLAIDLAKDHNCIILSLDSLCIYKEINIASAKPSDKELSEIRHFGINLKNVDEEFSVGEFCDEFSKAKNFAQKNNKNLIICGGSSFYLYTLLNGLSPKIPKLNNYLSNDEIFALAKKIDPDFTMKFSKNDTFRLQKWQEIYEFSSMPPSEFLRLNTSEPLIKDLEIFEIIWDKNELFNRICTRTDEMIKAGLIDEAKGLFDKFDENLKPLKSIGLKECKEFLDNKIDLDKLKLLINIHTRQLGKAQRTFNAKFKKTALNLNDCKKAIEKFITQNDTKI